MMDTNSSSKEETPSKDDVTTTIAIIPCDDNSAALNKEDETSRNNTKLNSTTTTIQQQVEEGESKTISTPTNSSNNNTTLIHSQSSPNIFYPKGNQVSNNLHQQPHHHHQALFNTSTSSSITLFDSSHSFELKQVSNNSNNPIPLHQTNQTNVQSTRNGKYSSLADNSFSSTNMPSPNNHHSTTVNQNTNVETKQTLRHRAFSNVKLISPRKRLKQSPSISSFQTTSDSWDVKENRKELDQLFDFHRKGYSKGSAKACCFNFWNAVYNTLCPVNRISNILLIIVIIHTLVCIIATSVILYSAGEQSVQEITRLNNMNLVQEMVQFLDIATKSSTELSMLFTVQSKYYNDTKGNGSFVEPITRFSTVVAPKLYTFSSSLSMVYYGNDNGDFAFAERTSTNPYLYLSQSIFQDQFSEHFKNRTFPATNNIYVFLTNDYFEPYIQKSNTVFRVLYNSTYDPRVRPWYTATESLEKGKPVWSDVFVDVNGNLSIAASLVLNNLNTIKPSYKEVIGVHLIFKKIQTYLLGLYSYTNNLMVLMENNGNLLTSNEASFPLLYNDYARINISYFTSATKFSKDEKSFWGLSNEKLDLIEKISNVMVSNNLLGGKFNGTIPCTSETFQATQIGDIPDQFCILNRFVTIKQYNTSTSFVSVSRLIDACGMDFYFIVSRTYYSFADVLVDHYAGLLVVLVVTVLIGTLAVLALTTCISYSLFFVSRKLYYISKLRQEDKPKKSLAYKAQRAINMIFYEIHTLQKCLDSVERANSSFIKYIPRSVVKFIVEGSSSAKLGMINAEITIIFTDLANFTNISEALSIHNLLLVISRYFEVVTSNVQECGGIIDKYIGDGCMALFNTPYQPVTHHAEHASKAAIKIVKGLQKLNKEMEEVYKMKLPTEISARVGINTGNALIGNIGTHDRLNFTAVGDCVNVSSRLESLNRMYGTKILIGEGSVATFKGIDKLRGETKDHFSTMLDQREFSLSDLSQRMMNIVEYQVSTPRSFPRESAQSSADLGKEMSFTSSSNMKATSTSSSQESALPQIVTFFIDTICLKGKNQPVPVFAVQCDRKLATAEQIYIEKMLDLVRRELLEEKRLKDVIHLLRNLTLFFEENQLTDSPVFREHNTDHYGFKFGDEAHTPSSSTTANGNTTINGGEKNEEEISTVIEGDPYPVIYKAISKLKERLEMTLMEHEARKRINQTNKKRSLLSALSVPMIDTRSKSDPLIHPILPIIPDFSTTSLLDENTNVNIETVENAESTMAKYEYYRQMALMENENRRSSMKLDDFALKLHEK